MTVRILRGDCRDVLDTLPDGSVHTVVTSPPYFGLRDYGTGKWEGGDADCQHRVGGQVPDRKAKGAITAGIRPGVDASRCLDCGARRVDSQIGLETTPDEFVQALVEVFRKIRRVLRDDGTVWLNLGDSYASRPNGSVGKEGRLEGAYTGHDEFRRAHALRKPGLPTGLKHKDLIGVPWMVAFALRADGWFLRQDIIWAKPNPMPESVEDRCTKSHEYIFLLSKSGTPSVWLHEHGGWARSKPAADYVWRNSETGEEQRDQPDVDLEADDCPWRRVNLWGARDYYFDQLAIAEPVSAATITRLQQDVASQQGSEHPGGHRPMRAVSRSGNKERKPRPGAPTGTGKNQKGSVPWEGSIRNKRSVWTVATESFKGAHFATFPQALIQPCILAGAPARCCAACGAPHYRKTSRVETDHDGSVYGERAVSATGGKITGGSARSTLGSSGGKGTAQRVTDGFFASCDCNAGTKPGVVLDPFGGAGTTGLVADKMGREGLLIELNPAYIRLAQRRLRARLIHVQSAEAEPEHHEHGPLFGGGVP